MNPAPFLPGDFVWCAFPQHENPNRPGPLHVGYAVAVFGGVTPDSFVALIAYTTSQPWTGASHPPGVYAFDRREASGFGQRRAFVLDLRRLALVPVTSAWFPHIGQPGSGVQGRASAALSRELKQAAEDLLTRRSELVERLGPLWPGSRR